jgi:hypothetical protein
MFGSTDRRGGEKRGDILIKHVFGSKEGKEGEVRYGSQGEVMYFKNNLLFYP